MKKIVLVALGLSLLIACKNDDDSGEQEQPNLTFDYFEDLSGDLSNTISSPDVLAFVIGNNFVTAVQSSSDVDYFTFTVPNNHVLSQIVVDEYQSSDAAGFIGIVSGNSFPTGAQDTDASDLLGGLVYGIADRGDDILAKMGNLNGVQGFTGALPAGSYTVWLNQTGVASEVSLKFVIKRQ